MTDEAEGRGAPVAPRSLTELRSLRTDYEDVTVPELGGAVLRVYSLSGTARAKLVPDMARLAAQKASPDDPEVLRAVLVFEGCVVGASLGYGESEWDGVMDVLPVSAIERLYEVAGRLSGIGPDSKDEASAGFKRRRSAVSGTA